VRQPISWVLVADGGIARIYRTTGENGAHRAQLELVTGGTFSGSDPAHLGPRPGKNFSSTLRYSGHGVTTHEGLKRRAEEEFIAAVLAWIEKPAHLAAFERLIVAAPPRTLGEIRFAASPALEVRIHREINGDLTKLPIKDLERRVMACILDLRAERSEAS
jgi:protein required for attachment to host cells